MSCLDSWARMSKISSSSLSGSSASRSACECDCDWECACGCGRVWDDGVVGAPFSTTSRDIVDSIEGETGGGGEVEEGGA